jgi:hypothetical protein
MKTQGQVGAEARYYFVSYSYVYSTYIKYHNITKEKIVLVLKTGFK